MTSVKLDSKLAANASLGIEEHIGRLYARPGMRIVAVVELAHVERTQPAPDEDKEPSLKLAVKHLEVARGGRQEDVLRQAMNALHTARTATGTLTEDGDVKLSDRTLGQTNGELFLMEAARLRVVAENWAKYARNAASGQNLTVEQLRKELNRVAQGLQAAAEWASDGD